MRVDYINADCTGDRARLTFVGYDPATGKRRRPMIELDTSDMCQLIDIIASYRAQQQRKAEQHQARVDSITTSLKEKS